MGKKIKKADLKRERFSEKIIKIFAPQSANGLILSK
jgi:hypothetical protein